MRVHPAHYAPGTCFHIYNHAVDDRDLFCDPGDYKTYLHFLEQQITQDFSIISYCLMPNHFHFLIRQNTTKPVSLLLEQPNKRYARYFNHKYSRKGRLFQSKLQHKVLLENSYLINVCAYIHANPLAARLVDKPEDWEYSNFPDFMGLREGGMFSQEFVMMWLPDRLKYRQLVMEVADHRGSGLAREFY